MSIDKAIVAATDKKYSEFEKSLNVTLNDKMKATLAGFVNYLNKSTFKKTDKAE